jgi:tryptophanyl-tRNA synthetase
MSLQRVLTGITTSGTPHLGNYAGAVRPTVRASRLENVESFYFLADYHALIKTGEPARVQRSTLEIAATWLACGLDPEKVTFYRQSDIPEIPELTWLLTCVTGKGLLNRAHAYKASVDKNAAAGVDADHGVTAGLFMYPVLMAADILMFNAHQVPVGRDQIQHIEMARDIASSFNHLYGEHFTLPEAAIEEHVATLPGLDGRKMSKSYDNTIPLFTPRDELRKLVMGILTDSRLPGEPKETEGSALFQLYQAFSTAEESAEFAKRFREGIAWGEAKMQLFEQLDREIAPMRSVYNELIQNPASIERTLKMGAEKARSVATPFTTRLRSAVGLRPLDQTPSTQSKARPAASKAQGPSFKQYREESGLFHFKMLDALGQVLLESHGFESPKDAGQAITHLRQEGPAGLKALQNRLAYQADEAPLVAALKELQAANE